jgi:hypothetical protein
MKTLLDDFHTWFLHAAIYAERDLRVIIAEGFRAAEAEDINILGHVIKDMYAINTSAESRLVEVRFHRPIAWQLVDESYTSGDEYEVIEERSAVGVLTRSRYLDYVMANHGWFEDIGRGPAKLYRVWTENEVIDVVACEPPTVEPYEGHTTNG